VSTPSETNQTQRISPSISRRAFWLYVCACPVDGGNDEIITKPRIDRTDFCSDAKEMLRVYRSDPPRRRPTTIERERHPNERTTEFVAIFIVVCLLTILPPFLLSYYLCSRVLVLQNADGNHPPRGGRQRLLLVSKCPSFGIDRVD